MSTRKERKQAKIQHFKRLNQHVTNFVTCTNERYVSLFDEIHTRMGKGVKIKVQGIYSSPFCKG